jgi:hypothetical protein
MLERTSSLFPWLDAWMDGMRRAAGRFAAICRGINWIEVEQCLDRIKAARKLPPTDVTRQFWEVVARATPAEVPASKWRKLPSPLRGRPKGGPVANDPQLLDEMAARVAAGEKRTTAARAIYQARGFKGDKVKGRAGHLVTVFNQSRK